MMDDLKVIVPEDFGRRMSIGVFLVRDLIIFVAVFVGFVSLALLIPGIWAELGIVISGIIIAWLFAFHKVDNLDYYSYLSLKYTHRKRKFLFSPIELFDDEKTLYNGNAFFRIIRVDNGIPFDFMSYPDKIDRLIIFEKMLNACDFPMQFIVKTMKIKADVFDSLIREKSHLAEEYRALIRKFTEGVHIQIYYVVVPVFRWELKGDDVKVLYRKASEILDIRTGVVLEYLNVLGIGGEVVKGAHNIYNVIKTAV